MLWRVPGANVRCVPRHNGAAQQNDGARRSGQPHERASNSSKASAMAWPSCASAPASPPNGSICTETMSCGCNTTRTPSTTKAAFIREPTQSCVFSRVAAGRLPSALRRHFAAQSPGIQIPSPHHPGVPHVAAIEDEQRVGTLFDTTTPCTCTRIRAKVCAQTNAHGYQYAIGTHIGSTSRPSNPELR